MTQAPTPGPLSGDEWTPWTPWTGGPCPHPPSIRVRVCYRDGTEDEGQSALARWWHEGNDRDILAYKLAPTAPVEASGSERDGYVKAFYEIADMLGIGAQAASPAEVWSRKMRPRLLAALSPQPSGETREWLEKPVNLGCPTDEPSVREMIEHYYRSHTMPEPTMWTERYVAALIPAPVASGGQHSSGPDEPTEEMIQAALKVDLGAEDERWTVINLWQTMKAAAPVAETAGEAVAYRVRMVSNDPPEWALMHPEKALDFLSRKGWESQPLYASPVPAQDDDKLRTLDVTEDEVAVLLEVMAYAGDEVANAGAANSLFLKAEALSVDLKSTAAQVNIPGKAGSCDQAARVLASTEGLK